MAKQQESSGRRNIDLNINWKVLQPTGKSQNSLAEDANVNFLHGCFPSVKKSEIKEIVHHEDILGNVDLAILQLLEHPKVKNSNITSGSHTSVKNATENVLANLKAQRRGAGVEKLLNQARAYSDDKMGQDISDIPQERQCLSTKVDEDIMAVFMRGYSFLVFKAKLDELETEIEWNRGSSTVTVWRRSYSTSGNVWSKECRNVLSEFMSRYEKVTVQKSVDSAVIKKLPQLEEKMPQGKLLVKSQGDVLALLLVCLKSDTEPLLDTLLKSVRAIEKEEDRKRNLLEVVKLDNICREHMILLKQTGFNKELVVKYPKLKVTLDLEKNGLRFEGPSICVGEAINAKYKRFISRITEGLVTLPSSVIGSFISRRPVQKYLRKKLAKDKISAVFFHEREEVVKIVAVDSSEYSRARVCLSQAVMKAKVPLLPENYSILQNEKWTRLFLKLKKQELLQVCVDMWLSSFILYGVSEVVLDAKKEIRDLIETERVQKICKKISKDMASFLKNHMSEEFKDIEKQLKSKSVFVQIDQGTGVVHIKGKREGIQSCMELLSKLCLSVATKKVEFCSPGASELISGENGQRLVKMLTVAKKLMVKTIIRKKQISNETEDDPVEISSIQKPVELTIRSKKNTKLADSRQKEGIKLSLKYGNIADEKADILVNSALPNLNIPTACGLALNKVGGPSFVGACKPHTNLQMGKVACTTGGNLACRYVLHAVCCNWDGNQGKAEKVLHLLLSEILHKCVELGANSVALPVIGSGHHKFPEGVVFRVLREEVEKASARYPSSSLKNIRIIAFDSNASQASQPVSAFQVTPESACRAAREMSFGQVLVSLREGDITKYPVDAIINTLPRDLNLSNGGSLCERIFQAGSQAIQEELNSSVKKSTGSVIKTNAGSMTNTRLLLHFIPSSADNSDLQHSIEECFNVAKSQALNSVSISTLGNSSVEVSPERSAKVIVNAVKRFSISKHRLSVNIVVSEKKMLTCFEAALQGIATESDTPPLISRTSDSPQHGKGTQDILARFKPIRIGEAKEVVILHFLATLQQEIDTSLQEINKFVKDHIGTKNIEHEKIWKVLKKYWSETEDLARVYDVSITCQTHSVASVEGLVTNVSDCKEKLWHLFNKYVEDECKTNQLEFISKNVQWFYFNNRESVPYNKEINADIEEAFMENKESVSFVNSNNHYAIDFSAMTEKNRTTGEVRKITRTPLRSTDSGIALPTQWVPQEESQLVQLVSLETGSSEYRLVHNLFNVKGVSRKIVKVERIQNPVLYKAYLVKKQTMKEPVNEMRLFHGTVEANIQWINANNFNRSYTGINGVMFGDGVYFARSAAYSLRYSRPSTNQHCYMYVAKVLVGKYSAGHKGLRAPPSRNDPGNPGLLYDSVVDNVKSPSIFVVFLDHQCYPEYLITFT